ncbi:MAG: ion transporter [Myxococcota bacterium]|nr:ion transporter [Myxococcota bacterium]
MRERIDGIIFGSETPGGRLFDILLIALILASVFVVMLDSVASVSAEYGPLLYKLEWIFTLIFKLEYGLRLWTVRPGLKYALSFFGLIDLLAILPTYLSVFFPGSQYLTVIRLFRVLRIFRILKLVQFMQESNVLVQGLKGSARKICVFIFTVLILVTILGAVIYAIEGSENGFTSIPKSVYWAIVTLTTVGYGDMAPSTNFGQFIAAVIMLLGYGIIAVPAGIVTSELASQKNVHKVSRACPSCSTEGHDFDSIFCKYCSRKLLA